MSADNWTVCPACKAKAIEARVAARRRAEENYGKVSRKDYRLLCDAAEEIASKPFPDHMREDYEIGMNEDGGFFVSYRASCQDCPFEFAYRHEADALKAQDGQRQAKPRR